MSADRTSQAFFEAKYQTNPDPWQFASSAYEQARYQAIVQALPPGPYRRAFEPGCSIGVLTAGLAPLCDELYACDISPTAVAQARHRCHSSPHVHITVQALPEAIPDGELDLIVFSEIGYYFPAPQLTEIADRLISRLAPSGLFLAAHWLGRSDDHCLSGDHVHQILHGQPNLKHAHAQRFAGFRLDLWSRA